MDARIERVSKSIINHFQEEHGYCDVADAGDTVLINSGSGKDTIKVTIEVK